MDRIVDSRRLMGPNLFSPREGAVLEVACSDDERPALLLEWRMLTRELASRLGWAGAEVMIREVPGGAHCFLAAPIDALLTATEINEQAWRAAEATVEHGVHPDVRDLAARLRVHRQHEALPRLVALQHAAHHHHRTFTFDDEVVSIGAGVGSCSWPLHALPAVDEVAWDALRDVPVALITGSNGKTTTSRLLAAMLAAQGWCTGLCSTDGVWVGGALVDTGDYSGPAGARLVLRHRQVQAAALETARGGMLRRGLATTRAQAAVVTRVAADHLGEYGVHDLETLARVKLLVARAVVPGGRLVLNADDPTLVALAPMLHPTPTITWFSLDDQSPVIAAHLAGGGEACFLASDDLRAVRAGVAQSMGPVAQMPLMLGGAARHNVANALAAIAAALAMDVSPSTIAQTLLRFGRAPADNPGRLMLYRLRDATVVVDFVHNPDGWQALWQALSAVDARRRIVLFGQAGDRDDAALAALAAAVGAGRPDRVIVKEMPKYSRGRPPFEVRERLVAALESIGAVAGTPERAASEGEGIAMALADVRAGDLIVLAVHDDLAAAEQRLREAGATVA